MIELENVSFRYKKDDPWVLESISLEIHPGQSYAIMGPNGSGKTTLIRLLNGLLRPTDGKVVVDGMSTRESDKLVDIRKSVGMVFQNPDNQIVSATVEREIAFGMENLGVDQKTMHAQVDEMLDRFRLSPYRFQSPHYLSGGEKQRLALATVLAMHPHYLVLDEPTSLLDPVSRREILTILRSLPSEKVDDQAMSTILITQFPEETLDADHLIILYQGGIALQGPPHKVYENIDFLQEIGLETPARYFISHMLKKYKI